MHLVPQYNWKYLCTRTYSKMIARRAKLYWNLNSHFQYTLLLMFNLLYIYQKDILFFPCTFTTTSLQTFFFFSFWAIDVILLFGCQNDFVHEEHREKTQKTLLFSSYPFLLLKPELWQKWKTQNSPGESCFHQRARKSGSVGTWNYLSLGKIQFMDVKRKTENKLDTLNFFTSYFFLSFPSSCTSMYFLV